ncbi:MAG: DUF502 domain-containing protein [Bdellovibrionales bacterium]
MKKITATFLKGLFTLLPLLLSIYVFLWFLNWIEGFSKGVLTLVWPDSLYLPGMGTIFAVVLIFAFGTVVDQPFTRWIFKMIEGLFQEVPIIKTVYIAIKDFTEYLQPGRGKKANQVVLVKFAGTNIEMIGLMTRESLQGMPEPVTKPDRVAVYFPYSYQFGGFTLFIPREWVHPTNLPVEAAMRSIITAWLPGQDKKLEGL